MESKGPRVFFRGLIWDPCQRNAIEKMGTASSNSRDRRNPHQVMPIPSMHGIYIFTYVWFFVMVNVGKYAMHGSYGMGFGRGGGQAMKVSDLRWPDWWITEGRNLSLTQSDGAVGWSADFSSKHGQNSKRRQITGISLLTPPHCYTSSYKWSYGAPTGGLLNRKLGSWPL